MRSLPPRVAVLAGVLVAASLRLRAQGIPLATLSGRVQDESGAAVAGASVTAESPRLQGKRTTQTLQTGEYLFRFLPPGRYVVRYELAGTRTVEKSVSLAAAGEARLDVTLAAAAVAAEVVVTADASAGSPLDTTQVTTNFKKPLTDRLPIDRTLRSIALLAPGVTDNGPAGGVGSANARPGLVISGAQAFESLFLVDGAVVNENLRGQPQDLFIEDAIEETTVLSGSVSPEYGRFTGGVVNVMTRSGGNDLHGSFRTNFTSDAWRSLTPVEDNPGEDPRIHRVDETYEGTLGGPILRDRIWFFAAGREQSVHDSREVFLPKGDPETGDQSDLLIPYAHSVQEGRAEGKLTGNVTPSHNLVAAYTTVRPSETGLPTDEAGPLATVDAPHWNLALNYNGILSSRLFVEAQYSKRKSWFIGNGSPYSDFVRGTRIDVDRGLTLNSPAGSAADPEEYGNESWLAKASYLLSTEMLGTHDLRAGYERFQKTLFADYNFSGSGFVVFFPAAILRDNEAFPVIDDRDGTRTTLEWRKLLRKSSGDRFLTQSAFFSDRVQLGARWTLQLGLRYDKNDARNSADRPISTAGAWSPRLAAQFDASGKGSLLVNAGYARYVAGLHEGIVQLFSEAGQPSILDWRYTGPCINCNPNAPTPELLTAQQALALVEEWFNRQGQFEPPSRVRIQGVSRVAPTDGLVSPSAHEYTFGVGMALGAKGWARADFVYRNYDDFYDNRIDLTTGHVPSDYGDLDLEVLENSKVLDRRYEAVQTRIDYRFTPSLAAGASYTWSRLTGNVVGENDVVTAAPSFVGAYPEYQRESWSYPTGYLPGDQRHRARIWLVGEVPVSFGSIGASVLQSYQSGLPYEAVADVSLLGPDGAYVTISAYETPPDTGTYFFSGRGAFRTDSISSTDVALTLTARIFGGVDVFIQPQILNLFNRQGSVAEVSDVLTPGPDNTYQPFNPFTQRPVRGVNYELSQDFGTPLAYQQPRTFRFNVGVRF